MTFALLTRFDAASFLHRILAFLGCFEQVLRFLDSCHTSLFFYVSEELLSVIARVAIIGDRQFRVLLTSHSTGPPLEAPCAPSLALPLTFVFFLFPEKNLYFFSRLFSPICTTRPETFHPHLPPPPPLRAPS